MSTRRRRSASAPSGDALAAVLAQAAVDELEVGEQLVRRRVAVVAEAPVDERELAPVRLGRVLRAELGGRRAGSRARRARSTRAARRRRRRARSRARAACRGRAPRRAARASASARARSSASSIVSGPAAGLPSWSPPIQLPKRSGLGAPGTHFQSSPSSAGAASSSDTSKNQCPCRISSITRGRCARTSSVCQSAVTSPASSRLDVRAPRAGRGRGSSSSASRLGDAQVRGEDRPARRLGRVRREHELERDRPERPRELGRGPTSGLLEERERLGERLARARGPRPRTAGGGGCGGAARRCSRAGSRGRTPAARALWRSSGSARTARAQLVERAAGRGPRARASGSAPRPRAGSRPPARRARGRACRRAGGRPGGAAPRRPRARW